MIENTPQHRADIAREVNGDKFIASKEELVEQYREYAKRDLFQRWELENLTEEQEALVNKSAEMYSDLAASSLDHDFPALMVFFSNYIAGR